MEKQIEELAIDIMHETGFGIELSGAIAIELYDKGYRKQEWISVEDRLPKKHETVLVCSRGENYSVISIDCLCSSGKWYDQDTDVTHWMPLPQPPQEKGAER